MTFFAFYDFVENFNSLAPHVFTLHQLVISFPGSTMSPKVLPHLSESRMESRPVSRFSGRRVHLIGIGGCGMSGLARILIDSGAIVSGSEPKPNEQTLALAKQGATISRDQLGELLSKHIDLVVRTVAVPDWNLEYKAALRYGIEAVK